MARFRQGIDDVHGFVGLSVVEVFGVELSATEFHGGGQDGGIPVGDLVADVFVFKRRGGLAGVLRLRSRENRYQMWQEEVRRGWRRQQDRHPSIPWEMGMGRRRV